MSITVRDRIVAALDNLTADQLLRFKHKLSERKRIGFGLIENERTVQITQRIVSKFTTDGAIACTADILRAIDLHDEAENVENDGSSLIGGQGAAVTMGTGGAPAPVKAEPVDSQTYGSHFVDQNQVSLIKRVTAVKPILDHLLHKGLISVEMNSLIIAEKTHEDQMRKLMYDVIIRIGVSAKDELVRILETEESYLMDDLKGK